ncbi:deuterosome assembly protein 1 [Protobothrops mucrosquamatus]|uniref:deuterosome assembly protein 1 n=1 Tax=Protobothrops mucrosquamatus TaxID=103944 RepID=UPI00077596EB|nr:deuterosome assembly protein 1 [Protobothrops mucrosquamatus]
MEKTLEGLQEQMMARSVPGDAELQELMHQIDIMVNKKKLEWEKKLQGLEARMTIRDQELASAQSKLDQKGQEVGLLRQKLDSLQKSKYEMAQNYDAQLQALKTQFAKLTQSYEKLQLHQLKQNKTRNMEKCTENQEAPFQMNSLNQKLEEFRAKSREWDKQETLYQNHLVSLDAQRKLLSEKCNLFQKQAQNCKIQIHCQKLKQNDGDTSSQYRNEQLGVQNGAFIEPADRNKFFMEKLESTVSEIAVSRNKLQEENLKLQQEVKMYQRKCQNTEARLIEVRNELQSREDLLSMVELECQQLRKEVAKIEEYKNKEENQVKLQSAYAQCIKDLEIKKTQILILEKQQDNLQKELNEIRDRRSREEQSHCSEVERLRMENSSLTEELHQKEITIATIVKNAAVLEKQTMDLSKKEHKTCLDPADMLECKNGRLHKELLKLPRDTDMPSLVNAIAYFGTNHAKPASLKTQAKEEKSVQNSAQSPLYEHWGCCRTHVPGWHGLQDVITLGSNGTSPPERSSRDREPIADGRSPSPLEVLPPFYCTSFPKRNKSDILLNQVYIMEERQMPSPETLFPAAAAEKFLQEEERRAKDFEQILNSHIEELQRQSSNTIKNYATLKQTYRR